ncbi:MAG: TetR/AcrR family transcriptional regulator [Firmicutes bacterium]|nr:TetR/AcrR family transcriptional regulator [Bacillota bacterium]
MDHKQPLDSVCAVADVKDPKTRILEAAENLFADRGFDGVSIREIADQAQVNSAMIYYYFGNKEGLYRGIMEGILSEITSVIDRTIKAGGDPAERITQIVNNYISFLQRRRQAAKLWLRVISSEDTKHIEMAVNQYIPKNFLSFEHTIHEGIESGLFRQVDTRLAAISLIGMILLFFIGSPIINRLPGMTNYLEGTGQQLARHTLEIFFHGLQQRESANQEDQEPKDLNAKEGSGE